LAETLRRLDVSVWHDEFTLQVGDGVSKRHESPRGQVDWYLEAEHLTNQDARAEVRL
jgi:hypothetical protein